LESPPSRIEVKSFSNAIFGLTLEKGKIAIVPIERKKTAAAPSEAATARVAMGL
jgi:hypothetical protein